MFQNYDCNNPLDTKAANWARENETKLPLSDLNLRQPDIDLELKEEDIEISLEDKEDDLDIVLG
mgnify:FL=1